MKVFFIGWLFQRFRTSKQNWDFRLRCPPHCRVIWILYWKEHSSRVCSRSKFEDMVTKSNASLFVSCYVNQMWTICYWNRQWLDNNCNHDQNLTLTLTIVTSPTINECITNRQIYAYVMNTSGFTFWGVWQKMLLLSLEYFLRYSRLTCTVQGISLKTH